MSSRGEIRSVLQSFDQEISDSDASELAAEWQDNRFHADEVGAWLKFGVTDPDVAYQRRADQEDMPPYYQDGE